MKMDMNIPSKKIVHPDSPSLYRTKINPTYTSAEPVSLCAMIISIGTRITAATEAKFLNLLILNPNWLIRVASMRDVDILEISAGWNRTGPNSNHDLEPLTSVPRKITAIRSSRTAR